jgi:hypothetical protein
MSDLIISLPNGLKTFVISNEKVDIANKIATKFLAHSMHPSSLIIVGQPIPQEYLNEIYNGVTVPMTTDSIGENFKLSALFYHNSRYSPKTLVCVVPLEYDPQLPGGRVVNIENYVSGAEYLCNSFPGLRDLAIKLEFYPNKINFGQQYSR